MISSGHCDAEAPTSNLVYNAEESFTKSKYSSHGSAAELPTYSDISVGKDCTSHTTEKSCDVDHEVCFWISGKDEHCASRSSCEFYRDEKDCDAGLDGHCIWSKEGGGKCEFHEEHPKDSPTPSPTHVWYKHTLTPTTPGPTPKPSEVPTR